MLTLILVILSATAIAGIEKTYTVYRQDYEGNRQVPFARQSFNTGPNGVYRVNRQDFSNGYGAPFSQPGKGNWPDSTPSSTSNSLRSIPLNGNTPLPRLFIPASTQQAGEHVKPNYNRVIPASELGNSPRDIYGDYGVLPAISNWRHEEEPLSPESPFSKTLSSDASDSKEATVKYHSINDEVEISDDQQELLEASILLPELKKARATSKPIRLRRRRSISYQTKRVWYWAVRS